MFENFNDVLKKRGIFLKVSSVAQPEQGLSKKQRRNFKKRRNNKGSDDVRMVPDLTSVHTSNNTETQFYGLISHYADLNMPDESIYTELLPYLMTPHDLKTHNYPPNISERYYSVDPLLRECCRCHAKYRLSKDRTYHEVTNACFFHPGRRNSFQGVPDAGLYSCCNQNAQSTGCKTWKYHVSMERFPEDQVFREVREKRQVKAGQAKAVYALDCEMSYTTGGMEVVKLGMVDLKGITLYETFVLPQYQVLDYNTEYSGVSANDLKGVTTTLHDVQEILLRILNTDSILVGHSLECDLRALKISHQRVIDTAILFPGDCYPYKSKLKTLASNFLGKTIQGKRGHFCIEDARTCMELILWRLGKDVRNRPPLPVPIAMMPFRPVQPPPPPPPAPVEYVPVPQTFPPQNFEMQFFHNPTWLTADMFLHHYYPNRLLVKQDNFALVLPGWYRR